MNSDDNNGWTAPPGELLEDRYNEDYYRNVTIPSWKEMQKFYKKYGLNFEDWRLLRLKEKNESRTA